MAIIIIDVVYHDPVCFIVSVYGVCGRYDWAYLLLFYGPTQLHPSPKDLPVFWKGTQSQLP